MAVIEIKNWLTGAVIWSGEAVNITDAVNKAAALRVSLSYANLSSADLSYANLSSADLSYADLSYANLRYANLRSADLSYANLRSANLSSADLRSAKNAELVLARTRILPGGDLIGWKKCNGGIIVKLRIPQRAERSHAFGRKCRAQYADVLQVIGAKEAVTLCHGPKTVYRKGKRVRPDKWDDDYRNECSNGIHFYITKEEAEAH